MGKGDKYKPVVPGEGTKRWAVYAENDEQRDAQLAARKDVPGPTKRANENRKAVPEDAVVIAEEAAGNVEETMRSVRFNDTVDVFDTHSIKEYDRKNPDKPWTRLTKPEKLRIKKELNDFKRNEMKVDPQSEKYTRFHK